jgi:hypothetical protein
MSQTPTINEEDCKKQKRAKIALCARKRVPNNVVWPTGLCGA